MPFMPPRCSATHAPGAPAGGPELLSYPADVVPSCLVPSWRQPSRAAADTARLTPVPSRLHPPAHFCQGHNRWSKLASDFSDPATLQVVLVTKMNVLLIFIPLASMANRYRWGDGTLFAFALLGLMPLAERLGFVTEQLAGHTTETTGGLLNATFGNATEMIVSLYAIKGGLLRVVQLSLLVRSRPMCRCAEPTPVGLSTL